MTSMSAQPDAARRPRHRRQDGLRTHWFALTVVLTVAFLVVTEIYRQPASVGELVWLMHTGAVVFLIALSAARRIPPAVPATVRRMRTENQAGVEVNRSDQILANLNVVCRRYARVGVPIGVALMAMFWLWASGDRAFGNVLFWLELVAAAGAGYVVGGFVGYGRLGHILTGMGLCPVATPGHPDGAAGLRPVGALYLREALIVSLIGVFAGVWWLLFPVVGHYRNWSAPYLGIVLTCVVVEFAALFLPLLSFHRQMQDQRSRLLPQADDAARRLEQIDRQESISADPTEVARLREERERVLARWEAIDTMPTWPIDARIRKRFAWSNAAMLIPVLLQILNAPQILQQLSSAIASV